MREKIAVTWSVMSVQTQKNIPLELAILPPNHVDDRDARPQDRSEKNYDVPRSPFGEHGGSVQPDDQHEHTNDVFDASRFEPTDDVVR